MKGIPESRKAGVVSAIAAAVGCLLLWGAMSMLEDLVSLRPMIKRQTTPFWLSAFLLLFAGMYFYLTPDIPDDK